MRDVAIRAEGLSKRYRIGGPRAPYKTIREPLMNAGTAPLRRARAVLRGESAIDSKEMIWALKDVSFEVRHGEVLGIIGRNGAGKTTLLKILSRITKPTEGYAEVRGRVGSLLEVGTGFHPELTGRENIYLYGAILGMQKAEIDNKLREIVDFSGVEEFVETPVKHYSSGMYVRLAFAVAAHLEPEVLLVDEVLAVGDAAFQRKCLGKMRDVAGEGRTILFVSHNMAAVQHLCTRAMHLGEGCVLADGTVDEVVAGYTQLQAGDHDVQFGDATVRRGTGRARYTRARVVNGSGQTTGSVPIGEGAGIELYFRVIDGPMLSPRFGVTVQSALGQSITRLITGETHGEMPAAAQGGVVRLQIDRLDLLPAAYYLTIGLSDRAEQADFIEDALRLDVIPAPVYPTGKLPPSHAGFMYIPCSWTWEYE